MRNKILFFSKFFIDFSAGVMFSHEFIALTKHGMTPSGAMKLVGLTSIIGVLANLPAGILSDKYGYKLFTIVGFLFKVASLVVLTLFHSELSAYVSFIMYSLGFSFEDGAFKSWLISPFKSDNKRIEKVNIILGKIRSWSLLLGALIGSFLYDYSVMYPWYLALIVTIIGFTLALFVKKEEDTEIIDCDYATIIKIPKSIKTLFQDKSILSYMNIELFSYAAFGLLGAAAFPYFNEIFPKNIIARVGILQLSLSLGRIFGFILLEYCSKREGFKQFRKYLFYGYPLINAIIVLIPLFNGSSILFLTFIFIRSIMLSFYMPRTWTILDKIVMPHDKIRASAYSIIEIIRDGSYSLAIVAAGYLGGFPYYNIWLFVLLFSFVQFFFVLNSKVIEKNLE